MEEKKFELVTLLLKESRLFDTKNCPNNCLIKIKEGEADNDSDRTTLIWKFTFFIMQIIIIVIIVYFFKF